MSETKEMNPMAKGIKKYLVTQLIDPTVSWMDLHWLEKLAFIQKTPSSAIKSRKINNKEIPYVEIDFVERALNFISNFNWWYTIQDKGMTEGKDAKWRTYYEARVQMQCYIVLDWVRIEKWSFWAWKSYENIAVSKRDTYKSAESNAIKNFALTLWIWADKRREENEKISQFREESYNEDELISSFNTSEKKND
jgi:hypothetical protein